MAEPRKRKDIIKGIHPIVVASVTAKVCPEFIVVNALTVRDNKLFSSLDDGDNILTDAHQGKANQWQGVGLGRFMLQFLSFYHYHFYSKAVPI